MSTVATSEVLNLAADLLQAHGWIGKGGKGWIDAENADGPLCIEGAIAAAMGPSVWAYGGFTSGPNLCPAGQAVRDYLGLGEHRIETALFHWNDELRWGGEDWENVRTASEVIEVLRAAAVVEAARETEAAEVPA